MLYKAMKDFEVNKLLAEWRGLKVKPVAINGSEVQLDTAPLRWLKTVDYCNNWSDIVPVAIELGDYSIIDNMDGTSTVSLCSKTSLLNGIFSVHESPLRALTVCCIKIYEQQSKESK
ncbi:hypothetical protein VXS06_14765 [Photobacterium toruni]|uniref:Uncharacterized protein n=1 Tax=Photobacterium toruni TaxID=1935446 RepID=A0ABU6LAG9_9GAMM|nr:hypothetical protein [Photobacterium toruni]